MVSDISGEFVGTTPAPPTGDRVELTDLEVIQRWSLAVRGASAERSEVIAALRSDLAWLEGSRATTRNQAASSDDDDVPAPRRTANAPTPRRTAPAPRSTTKAATKKATAKRATAAKPATRKSAAKKSTARSSTSRGGTRRR